MAQLSISAAARAVGKDRGTLHRYIKTGKISVSTDAAGNKVIETSELLRVFGSLKGDGVKSGVAATVATPVENSNAQHVLEATLELLKDQLKVSQEREARLLAMLEHYYFCKSFSTERLSAIYFCSDMNLFCFFSDHRINGHFF